MSDLPLAVSVEKAAELISVSVPTLYRMRRDAQIEFLKVRGRTLVPMSEVVRKRGMRMSVEHIVKTHPIYFDAVKRGDKRFEIRRDDRRYQKGDILVQQRCKDDRTYEVEWDHFHKPVFGERIFRYLESIADEHFEPAEDTP